MPPKSEAQRRFMYSAMEGHIPGVSPSVGREFIKADTGKKLPKKLGKKKANKKSAKRAK